MSTHQTPSVSEKAVSTDTSITLASQLKSLHLENYPRAWIYNTLHHNDCRKHIFAYYGGKWAELHDRVGTSSRLLVGQHGGGEQKFHSRQYPNPSPGNSRVAASIRIIMAKDNRHSVVSLEQVSRMLMEGWKVWDHPQRPLDMRLNFRDTRSVERVEDVYNVSAPWEDTPRFFQLGVAIYQATGSNSDWKPGALIGDNRNAHLSPSLAAPTAKPWILTDMRSATSRGHLHKYRRPYGIGAGWGDYDLFYIWQSHGRRILLSMIPSQNQYDKVTEYPTFKFVSENGEEEVITRVVGNALDLANKNAEVLSDRMKKGHWAGKPQHRTAISSTINYDSHVPNPLLGTDIRYLQRPTSSYLVDGISCVEHIHKTKAQGDILFFLTGENEIERTCAALRERITNLEVLPLYSTLSRDQQRKVSERSNKRMCVVTTNMADTMSFIRIGYIVDSGLVNEKVYNPRARMEIIQTAPVSQGIADERATRACCTGQSVCYRLYTKSAFDRAFPKITTPMYLRSDLSSIILELCCDGHNDVLATGFVDPPDIELYLAAIEDLHHLGFLDHKAKITKLGTSAEEFALDHMSNRNKDAKFPVDPVWYLAIVEAEKLSCSCEIVSIAALLSTQKSIFVRPYNYRYVADLAREGWAHPKSDHLTLLNAFHAYQITRRECKVDIEQWCTDNFLSKVALETVSEIRGALMCRMGEMNIPVHSTQAGNPEYETNIRKALALSFVHHSAMQVPGRETYKTVRQNIYANVHTHSVLVNGQNEWVVFDKFAYSGIQYLQTVTAVEAEWLVDLPYFKNLPVRPDGQPKQPFVGESLESARARIGKRHEKS